ncbi:MAG: hypothetical protein JSV32_06690 [Dehalococcoidia bacterium]|nr:MAG: hypothetical protein JSV32_06690 [Dehalococcoidia bacterium]
MVEIETLKRLRIKKGDAIILKAKIPLSENAIKHIKEGMLIFLSKLGFLDNDVPILIFEEGIDIEVLTKE